MVDVNYVHGDAGEDDEEDQGGDVGGGRVYVAPVPAEAAAAGDDEHHDPEAYEPHDGGREEGNTGVRHRLQEGICVRTLYCKNAELY